MFFVFLFDFWFFGVGYICVLNKKLGTKVDCYFVVGMYLD